MRIPFFLIFLLLSCSPERPAIRVTELTCEDQVNPLAVDPDGASGTIRLSWKTEAGTNPDQGEGPSGPANRENSRQENQLKSNPSAAYELLVASAKKDLKRDKGDMWQTGTVMSAQNRYIPYEGKPLEPMTTYYWKVRVRDRQGNQSPWSEIARFNTGLKTREGWQDAEWISAPGIIEAGEPDVVPFSHWIWHPGVNEPNRNVFFRRTVEIDSTTAYIRLDITAYHKYQLFVNGKLLGDVNREWNTPTTAHYQLYRQRNLKPGKNVVAVQASSRKGPGALACGIKLIKKDGGGSVILPPLNWKCSDRSETNWNQPDFQPEDWTGAVPVAEYGQPPFGTVDRNPAMASPLLRREIDVSKKVDKAIVYMSGLGFSELYINGEKAGNEVLNPVFTDYTCRVPYTAKAITGLLKKGKNVFSVILGGGYYKEATADMFDFQDAPWSDRPKLLFLAEIQYADGTKTVISSDQSWKGSTGAIVFNSLRGGETMDARKEKTGWMLPGYDASGWDNAVREDAPEGKLVPQQVPPARVMETIEPVAVTEPREGLYLFDMGVNMTGWAALRVKGEKGQTIILDYNEKLNPDGTLDINHEASHTYGRHQTDKLILSGNGTETWEPRFTHHAFRYVQVTGLKQPPRPGDLTGKWVHTAMKPAGTFECSNEKLNKIHRAVVRGYRNYILHHPLDPLREKMGWTQDVWNMFEAGAYNFNVAPVYRKWFYDFLDAQDPNGHVPPVIPANYWGRTTAGGDPGNMSDPWWGGALVYLPWFMYDYYGDRSLLEEGFPAMKRYVDYIRGTSENNLVYWTLGDWGDVSHMEKGGQYRSTPVVESSTCAFFYLASLVEKTARLLENENEAEKYGTLAGQIRDSFNEAFFDYEKGIYKTPSQSAQVVPLYLGMVPEGYADSVLQWIVTDIRENDNHLTTGFVGILPLLNELSRRGRADVAYDLAVQEDYPSWYYMLKDGGTTITEYWNPDSGSKNIVNLGGPPEAWFYKYLAGIRPLEPGFREFTLQPYFPPGMDWLKAAYDSPAGKIVSSWKRQGNQIHYEVNVPVNTMASVTLPVSGAGTVSVNGVPLLSSDRVKIVAEAGRQIRFLLKAGNYLLVFNGKGS